MPFACRPRAVRVPFACRARVVRVPFACRSRAVRVLRVPFACRLRAAARVHTRHPCASHAPPMRFPRATHAPPARCLLERVAECAIPSRRTWQVTLFRKHPTLLEASATRDPVGKRSAATDAQEKANAQTDAQKRANAHGAYQFWQSRAGYFLGSPQGKSATRVLPGARPMSVHTFYPPSANLLSKCWAGFLDGSDCIGCTLRVVSPMGAPCILHYISCDFSFWFDKYRLLGRFSDHKPGGEAAGGLIPSTSFHAQSRELVQRCLVGDGGRERAREAYGQLVALHDVEEARRQVATGVCMRVSAVRDFVTGSP